MNNMPKLDIPEDIFKRQFSSFAKEIVKTMEEVSKIADKRISTFLLTIGTIVLFIALFWKLRPFGVQISDLKPIEFITVTFLSVFLLTAGSYFRLYQAKIQREINKELRATGSKMLEKSHSAALSLIGSGSQKVSF